MFERLRQGLHNLLGSRASTTTESAPPTFEEVVAREAHLLMRQGAALVELRPDFCDTVMLSLPGHINGPLRTLNMHSTSQDRASTMLTLPLRVEGRDRNIQITAVSYGSIDAERGSDFTLARASRRRIPPQEQAIEIVFTNSQEAQQRYLLQMDADLQPVGFQEFSRHQAVFDEIPPVAQMVAFLKATLHHRRTTLRSLSSLARQADNTKVRSLVACMQEKFSQSQDFTTPAMVALHALLVDKGRSANVNTVAALCLLADAFLGYLQAADLDSLPLPTSAAAVQAVAKFMGVEASLEEFAVCMPGQVADADEVQRTAEFLKSKVGVRNALTILTDLAEDSGSERSRKRVERLLARVHPDQVLRNDEHDALYAYLAERGRKVQLDTIIALSLYVDFEAGILSLEDIDAITPRRAFFDVSLYSMLAIAGAFDVDMRAYRIQEFDRNRLWTYLGKMVALSQGGLIARFLEKGQAGHLTLHLRSQQDVGKCRKRGLEYTGEVMGELPIIDHLDEGELLAFRACGKPVIACFGSEEKRMQWRSLDSVAASRAALKGGTLSNNFSFMDRYEVYHFNQRIVARSVAVPAKELVGSDNVVATYRDVRGNAHYQLLPHVGSTDDLTAAPRSDWEWSGAVLEFPEVGDFPHNLVEPTHEYLLGQPDDRAPTQKRLDRIYSGLEDRLASSPRSIPLSQHRAHLQKLREVWNSRSLRALLVGILDSDERDRLLDELADAAVHISVSEPLYQALDLSELDQFAGLAILYAFCESRALIFGQSKFSDLLLDELYRAADAEEAEVRALTCQLLGCSFGGSPPNQTLAVTYVLSRFLESDRPLVAQSAARSLAALALRSVVPQVELVRIAPDAAAAQSHHHPHAELQNMLVLVREQLKRKKKKPDLDALARLTLGVNEALAAGQQALLLTATPAQLQAMLGALLEAWRGFARTFDMNLHRLLVDATSSADIVRAYRGFVEEFVSQNEYAPFLGLPEARGKRKAATPLMRASAPLDLSQDWFAALTAALLAAPDLRLLRCSAEDKDLRRIFPEELHVFDEARQTFVPLLDTRFLNSDSADDERDLESLSMLYSPSLFAAGAPSRLPSHLDLADLASEVVRIFNLPPEHHKLAVNMLASLAAG